MVLYKHHHVAQSGSDLLIFLPLPSKFWDYGHVPPCRLLHPSSISFVTGPIYSAFPGAILPSIPQNKPKDRVERLTYLHVFAVKVPVDLSSSFQSLWVNGDCQYPLNIPLLDVACMH